MILLKEWRGRNPVLGIRQLCRIANVQQRHPTITIYPNQNLWNRYISSQEITRLLRVVMSFWSRLSASGVSILTGYLPVFSRWPVWSLPLEELLPARFSTRWGIVPIFLYDASPDLPRRLLFVPVKGSVIYLGILTAWARKSWNLPVDVTFRKLIDVVLWLPSEAPVKSQEVLRRIPNIQKTEKWSCGVGEFTIGSIR